MRKIILPGEEVDAKVGPIFKENGKTFAAVQGLYDSETKKFVPLKEKYIPSPNDMVIGIVIDVKFGGCIVDINSPYLAFLPTQEEMSYGTLVLARVQFINEIKSAVLAEPKKLENGRLLEINPAKIPRVIGKRGSMLNLLKQKTGCEIVVGRNGRIWAKGGNIPLLYKALKKIEKEAHTTGLTERISKMLEGEA